jgi:hypothetical protein
MLEVLADVSEGGDLVRIGGVAVKGAAVGVQVVGLVELPDLVAQSVLDCVAALFTEAVGPDVAVFDEVVGGVAEVAEDGIHVCRGWFVVVVGAALLLSGGADVAEFADAPVRLSE